MTLVAETIRPAPRPSDSMRATVFHGPGDIRVEEVLGRTPAPARP